MPIIIDRKRKKANFDNNWSDPFSLDEIYKQKARTIEIPSDSDNPIHKFLRLWGSPKLLLGKKCHALTNKKEVLSGYIVDVIPPNYLLLKDKGIARFSDVIAIGDE